MCGTRRSEAVVVREAAVDIFIRYRIIQFRSNPRTPACPACSRFAVGYTRAMTYYSGKDLARTFRVVRKNTLQLANEIPEASYSYRVTPETRSVGETLAHVAA